MVITAVAFGHVDGAPVSGPAPVVAPVKSGAEPAGHRGRRLAWRLSDRLRRPLRRATDLRRRPGRHAPRDQDGHREGLDRRGRKRPTGQRRARRAGRIRMERSRRRGLLRHRGEAVFPERETRIPHVPGGSLDPTPGAEGERRRQRRIRVAPSERMGFGSDFLRAGPSRRQTGGLPGLDRG